MGKPKPGFGRGRNYDEALCARCGKCCYKKIIVGRSVLITPFPCPFLDLKSHECKEYARRFEVNPDCLDIKLAFKRNSLPATCGYVRALAPPGYQSAIEPWDWDGQWEDFDALADELDVAPGLRELIRKRGPQGLPFYLDIPSRK